MSGDTLTNWVRQGLAQTGIDVSKFSSHSTTAASVSAAHRTSVNLDDILKQLVGHHSVVSLNTVTSH